MLARKTMLDALAQPAAKDLARARGGEMVFPDIHAYYRVGCQRFHVAEFDDESEEPFAPAEDKIGFLGLPGFENAALVRPKHHGRRDTPGERTERNDIALERVGAPVVVHGCAVEANRQNRIALADAPEFLCALYALHTEKMALQHI